MFPNRQTLQPSSPQCSMLTYSMRNGLRERTSTGGHSSVLQLSSSRQWTITSDMVRTRHRLDIVRAITSKVRTMAVTIVKNVIFPLGCTSYFSKTGWCGRQHKKIFDYFEIEGNIVCLCWSLIHGGMRLILLFLKSQVSHTVTVMPDSKKCSTLFLT